MEKVYAKEKQDLCDKILELQNMVKDSESEFRLHLSEDTARSMEREDALPEEKPATPQKEDLKARIEFLEENFKNKEDENEQLKEVQDKLNNELLDLKENKVELERELDENREELLNLKQSYEQKLERLKDEARNAQSLQDKANENDELVQENVSLQKEVGTLKITVKSLTENFQNVSEEKDGLQSAFQEAEVAWEEEKNNLQQQLYDSCLEASSFKDRLNKIKQEAGSVTELQEKLLEQNEAYCKLQNDAGNLENQLINLKKSLSAKEHDVDTLNASVEELSEGLMTQQSILEEHQAKLARAENEKAVDKEEICRLKEALMEAEKSVKDGEVKMQEILRNMKNLEITYKAQTIEATQQLNEKVAVLQEELQEVQMKLNQEKQSNNVIRSHIDDLKQQHVQEILSCKSQFETDIQHAVDRANWQQTVNDNEEPVQDLTTQPHDLETDVESRLNEELKNVDGFTRTIAGYLSELNHESFGENGDFDNSTTEKIETVLDDLRLEADAVYNLVNNLPAFYDPNITSLLNVWQEEKEILKRAVEQLKKIALGNPKEVSMGDDWRGVVLSAVLNVLKTENEMLTTELETIEEVAHSDVISSSIVVKRRQQKQDDLYCQSVDRLYEADRISMLSEIDELKKRLIAVKQELTNENQKLGKQLEAIQQQVKKREKEFLQQVSSKDELLQKERDLLSTIQAEKEEKTRRLSEANDLLTRERNAAKDLQDALSRNKTRLQGLESALEKERTQNTVIQTCLGSERARCSNLEQALKHERLNVDSRDRELEDKKQLLQDLSNREEDAIKGLEDKVLLGTQQLSELETQLREVTARNTKLETELADKESVSVSDHDKLKNLIKNLRDELERQKTENVELIKSLNEERKVSEDLKSSVETLHGVNEQIAEQEQLITELSQALDNERRVNEELRNALDNDYEENDKTDDRQLNAVKELQMSLTAVQEQLRNQITVVDQERNRVKRLRKERDIHEASALGARTKERNLEKELEKEKAAREMEVENLKDELEHEIALKKNLEEVLNTRNLEFQAVHEELQHLKGSEKMTVSKTPPNSPSRDRLNILRHDLKSVIDEHRVLLIMHKEYLEKHLNNYDESPEVSDLYSHIENLSYEMDRMKKQVGALSEGSPIRFSPMKTLAYERVIKQNKEMSDYLAKLTDEKSELRTTLCRLELQVSQHRDREANYLENMRRNKHEMETIITTERTRAAQDRLALHQTIEAEKRRVSELEDKLRRKEGEIDETKRSLQIKEDELERNKISAKRLPEAYVSHWTPTRIQKMYARYIKAEKCRKSLVYQKRYLVLLLGGFRANETRTLAMIAKMGAYPSYDETSSRFSPAFTKFRTAVRVVVAINRMQFLVAKSKKSIRQVMESADSKSNLQRNTPLKTKSILTDLKYDLSVSNHCRGNTTQSVPSRFSTTEGVDGFSSQNGDLSLDSRDASFAEIITSNTGLAKHTDSGVYSAFDYRPNGMVTLGASSIRMQHGQVSTGRTDPLKPRSPHNLPHSPPVRERPNSRGSWNIRPPFPASHHSYHVYQTESRRDARTTLKFDSDDLDRKIQTLDNLQQKLSFNRGTRERDR